MNSTNLSLALVDRRRLIAETLRSYLVPEHADALHSLENIEALERMLSNGVTPQVILLGCHRASDVDLQLAETLLERFEGRIALLCDFMPMATLRRLLQTGINGFLETSMQLEDLTSAIKQIASQALYIPPDYVRKMLVQKHLPYALTERQLSILELIVLGAPNVEISQKLGISEAVAKSETRAICQKLEVKNRTQAAMKAATEGIA